MAKRNWFESIEDKVPATGFEFNLPAFNKAMNLARHYFEDGFDVGYPIDNSHITPFNDFMADLEGFGFQDKGDRYEMTTNLGGQRGETDNLENAVKVELTGKDNRTVEISYEHSTSNDENCFYSHSQKTSVMLPADADNETVKAYFDEEGNVVVSAEKKVKEPVKNASRQIPVGVRHRNK